MTTKPNAPLTDLMPGAAGEAAAGGEGQVYDDGILRIEHDNYYVACRGQRVFMPLKNFLLLSRLAKNPGRLVTVHELWHDVWGNNESLNRDTLRVHIYRLRQKLAPF